MRSHPSIQQSLDNIKILGQVLSVLSNVNGSPKLVLATMESMGKLLHEESEVISKGLFSSGETDSSTPPRSGAEPGNPLGS